MKKATIHYKPIPHSSSHGEGYIALTIYPPFTWMDSPEYKVFVGGGGVGNASSLKTAEQLLLKRAQEHLRSRVGRLKAELAHYERELKKLTKLERLKDE